MSPRSPLAAMCAALCLVGFTPSCRTPGTAGPHSLINVDRSGLALAGYDPVSYFPEGGGEPRRGDPRLASTYAGATYRFANQHNLELFEREPERFAPRYGGWCAYAMVDGKFVGVDPKAYILDDDGLMLFYRDLFVDTGRLWQNEGPAVLEERADRAWAGLRAQP